MSLISGLRHILLHLILFQSGTLSQFLPLSYQMIAVSCYGLKSTCTAVRSNAQNPAQWLRFSCPEQLFWHRRTVKHPKPCTAVAIVVLAPRLLLVSSAPVKGLPTADAFPTSLGSAGAVALCDRNALAMACGMAKGVLMPFGHCKAASDLCLIYVSVAIELVCNSILLLLCKTVDRWFVEPYLHHAVQFRAQVDV